jgi:hypothetical protein
VTVVVVTQDEVHPAVAALHPARPRRQGHHARGDPRELRDH